MTTVLATRDSAGRRKRATPTASKATTVRCAIYTRKSSEEGLAQEFNSLDAQREAAEAFIASQRAEGWVVVPGRYDDGGYTGGNMERPALTRLLADIEARKIDCVVVYKVDRLSRSLMDFARIVEVFERHRVSFVSVTQHFNTTHSMGRLTLNILLSFAQFEREIIGERIRDKIAASRQKGKWTGGTPILGYDVDRSGPSPRLVVNPGEARRVREIFDLYLERGSLISTAYELQRRNWRTKAWVTRSGSQRGDEPFDKCRLHNLLTNVLYVGKVRHRKDVYPGEHEAILPEDLFRRVQARLTKNRNGTGPENRNCHGAILRGLLHCKACRKAMSHTFTTRGNKRYRYYTCATVIRNGRRGCRCPSLPCAEIERAVVDQIARIGRDKDLVTAVVEQSEQQAGASIARLTSERAMLGRALTRYHAELKRLGDGVADPQEAARRLAELNEQISKSRRLLQEIEDGIAEAQADMLTRADVAAALADFAGVWSNLSPREQVRVMNLLVHRIEFDAADSSIEITFHPCGIRSLAPDACAIETTPEVNAIPTAAKSPAATAAGTPGRQAKPRQRAAKEAAA